MMNATSFSLVIFGVLLNAAAQLFLKAGVGSVGVIALDFGSILSAGSRLGLHPFILGWLTCYVVSVIVWILALSWVDVSVAYPMLSLGYIVNALAASALFGEQLTPTKLIGIGIICLGVFVLARN
jgi:multidrug transporter EmrE-like cation transporter